MKRADVTLPQASEAPHQANHVEVLLFSQKAAKTTPSKSLSANPNSRTVNESIGMV
jgi:hypothetical protein